MKERVVMFGDAIIAIILTIMVLEIPIQYTTTGAVNYPSLLSAVGIYFISFCFVANVWFQTAYEFNKIDQMKNKNLVIYMLLLFLLSLVPSATRLLIEDTTQQTIFLYGVMTLIVTLVMRRLVVALIKQETTEQELQKRRVDETNRQDLFVLLFRILLLIFGFFFVKVALIIYLILPITAFLQNMVEREEDDFVETLDDEEQMQYFQDRNQLWGTRTNRYSSLLRESMRGTDGQNPERWQSIMNEWLENTNQELMNRKQLLNSGQVADKARVEHEIKQLEKQQDRLEQQQARLQQRAENTKKRKRASTKNFSQRQNK